MPCQLTPAQERQWREEGFVVVPGILSAKEAAAHVEELAQPPTEAAAAAGLNRHAVDPSFGTLATHEAVLDIVRQLLAEPAEPPRILQTMYLNKTSDDSASRLGIALHQDTHYIPNEPNTLLACWIALTDTDESNGGLFVVPGSHRGPLLAEDITIDEANHLAWEMVHKMRERDGTEWEQPFHSVDVTAAGFDESEAVALRVPAGSAVFFVRQQLRRAEAGVRHALHGRWLLGEPVRLAEPSVDGRSRGGATAGGRKAVTAGRMNNELLAPELDCYIDRLITVAASLPSSRSSRVLALF
jgi:hypothetical protein